MFVSLRLSLCLFDCLFCLCVYVSWSKWDQWLDPQCGLDSWVHPLTKSLNTVHSFISFHIPGIEAWNANNMQIRGSLALFKTRPVCGAGQRALLSQTHQSGLPAHSANSIPCLLTPLLHRFLLTLTPLPVKLTLQRIKQKKAPASEKASTMLKWFYLCELEESLVVSRTFLGSNIFLGMVKIFRPFENDLSEVGSLQVVLIFWFLNVVKDSWWLPGSAGPSPNREKTPSKWDLD